MCYNVSEVKEMAREYVDDDHITVRMETNLVRALNDFARRFDVSRSEVVRRACWEYLADLLDRDKQTVINLETKQRVLNEYIDEG